MKNCKIKWINKFSGETGYVKEIKKKDGHFENTFDANEAKCYSAKAGISAVKVLVEIGEGVNNNFELVTFDE